MSREEKLCMVAKTLCGIDDINNCTYMKGGTCQKVGRCRIKEKTDAQLDYILSSIDTNTYLEACAGSGKTEILGMKAAYEICRWTSRDTGIAVLSFTNDATATIQERITTFYRRPLPSNHFIGTFSSFIHGYIAQKFGYKFYRQQTDKKDKSFHIVDSSISPYSNKWLENYVLEFPILRNGKIFKIYANQLKYHIGKADWFIGHRENSISITELYESDETQKYLASLREKKKSPGLFSEEYFRRKIKDCKTKFWEAGFATFDDINYISSQCLSDGNICSYISMKFPLILIDECQDLSKIELSLLSKLINAGTVVHYIGDLHQAIYSFKDSLPEYFSGHIGGHGFITLALNDNFRSTQKVVDVSRAIGKVQHQIIGRTPGVFEGDECFYVEYTDEADAVSLFRKMLVERGIRESRAVVLTRTQITKDRLNGSGNVDYLQHPIINAIQCWKLNTPTSKRRALDLVGQQLQKWIVFQGRSTNYYYPSDLCGDAITWRLMLRDMLEDLCEYFPLAAMDGITYASWYSSNKRQLVSVLNEYLQPVIGKKLDETASFIRTPPGTASAKIAMLSNFDVDRLKAETVHAVKGETYDAVLLLSAQDGRGRTGYWENWLNSDDEASRICYVACTRPRYLLCWGVSKLEDESKRKKLENLGLKQYKN